MLTDQELRQAAFALSVIDERGDPHEFEYILAQKCPPAPGTDRWVKDSIRYNLGCHILADRLSGLLGESKRRCSKLLKTCSVAIDSVKSSGPL